MRIRTVLIGLLLTLSAVAAFTPTASAQPCTDEGVQCIVDCSDLVEVVMHDGIFAYFDQCVDPWE